MLQRKRMLMLGGVVLLLAVLTVYVCLLLRAPRVKFQLTDGSTLELMAVRHGNTLRFYEGNFWQSVLFSICRSNIPPRYRGYEIHFSSSHTNGSLGLQFQHFNHGNSLPRPVNGSVTLAEINAQKNDVVGLRKLVDFRWSQGSGRCVVHTENIYWVLPDCSDHELHFRLAYDGPLEHLMTNYEFTIPNPALQ